MSVYPSLSHSFVWFSSIWSSDWKHSDSSSRGIDFILLRLARLKFTLLYQFQGKILRNSFGCCTESLVGGFVGCESHCTQGIREATHRFWYVRCLSPWPRAPDRIRDIFPPFKIKSQSSLEINWCVLQPAFIIQEIFVSSTGVYLIRMCLISPPLSAGDFLVMKDLFPFFWNQASTQELMDYWGINTK